MSLRSLSIALYFILVSLSSFKISSQANSKNVTNRRHIPNQSHTQLASDTAADHCLDKLCYGIPDGCLGITSMTPNPLKSSECWAVVTSKTIIDPSQPSKREILFELISKFPTDGDAYFAVGFSETGRMRGLVTECRYTDRKGDELKVISLQHSYNLPNTYTNIPVHIRSGIKNLGVSTEDGNYLCRWIVQSSVEYSYDPGNGTLVIEQADLAYKDYYILLATGKMYDNSKLGHSYRVASEKPISLTQTGPVKSLGSHILLRIHGSLMIVIWVGLVTIAIVLARYYKNSKINDLAVWFMVHRTFMLAAWFGSLIAVIFAYMYAEAYHPGPHSLSGTACLVLSTIQVVAGLLRPGLDSANRIYFNWAHFAFGNLSYLLAMVCLVTASFLPQAHLPPVYIWVIALFVLFYAIFHMLMTIHQFVCHKSSSKYTTFTIRKYSS